MMVTNGSERWEVSSKKQCGEWLNIVAERSVKQTTRKIKSTTGNFVTVNAKRSKYNLAWNGKRFAASSEIDSIENQRPWLLEAMEEYAKANWEKKRPVSRR